MSEMRYGIDIFGVDFSTSELDSLSKTAFESDRFLGFLEAHSTELGIEIRPTFETIEKIAEEYEEDFRKPFVLAVVSDVVCAKHRECWCDVVCDEYGTAFFGVPKLIVDAWDVDADLLSKFPPSAEAGESEIREVWKEAGFAEKDLPSFSDIVWAFSCN